MGKKPFSAAEPMTLLSGDQLNSFSEIGATVCQPCWCFEHQNYHLTMVLLNTRQGVRLDQNDGITIVRWQTSNGAQHQNRPCSDFEARRLAGGGRLVGTVTATNTVQIQSEIQIQIQIEMQNQIQISGHGYCHGDKHTVVEVQIQSQIQKQTRRKYQYR